MAAKAELSCHGFGRIFIPGPADLAPGPDGGLVPAAKRDVSLEDYESGRVKVIDSDCGTLLEFIPDSDPRTTYVVRFEDGIQAIGVRDPHTGQVHQSPAGEVLWDVQVDGRDPKAAAVASRLPVSVSGQN